jgi:Gas vesicle synthesis protein GvpL/GvpF
VAASGVWVYAVTEPAAAASLGQLSGVNEGLVRPVEGAGLTALAEDVPLAEFGEQALRRNLEDLAWLEATARAHHRVIEALAQQGPAVPMRLATVYSGDAGVAAMLAERATDFRAALDHIRGRKEWGVKAYAAGRSGPAAASPDTGEPGRRGAGAGVAYLRRRRDQLTAQKKASHQMLADAEAIHAELSRHAAGARLHPPQAPELTGSKARMVLNAAYLLDEPGQDFAALVATMANRYPDVRFELTGPWPPYSFAGGAGREDVSERA